MRYEVTIPADKTATGEPYVYITHENVSRFLADQLEDAGFSVVEAAQMLGISKSKAYLHWAYAKALMGQLFG